LFWDDLHPTTRGHNILATTAGKVLAQGDCRDALAASERQSPDWQGGCGDDAVYALPGADR
jgi:phospholipase/lecithinase/hemolysin